MTEYTVMLTGTEDADTPEDAIRQYVERLAAANSAGVQLDIFGDGGKGAILSDDSPHRDGFVTFYSTRAERREHADG
jgi:hypothetical protein